MKMGGDREFFSDMTSGFSVWKCEKTELSSGESIVSTAEIYVSFAGKYFLQFQCDYSLRVKLGDVEYEYGYIPMLHNEIREIPVTLQKGKNLLQITLVNTAENPVPAKFSARFLDEEGNILIPEKVAPLPEMLEGKKVTQEMDLASYTPGTGNAFNSFGRFGFSKGDGLLDYSMPSFGIVSRTYTSGHPQYHKNIIWNFSLLPDGEKTSCSIIKAYKVPENEEIRNDWSGVRWTRKLAGNKKITFDYSVLTPALLVETDLAYMNIDSLVGISAWKKITLPLSDGLHTRSVENNENDICYDKSRDGALSRNYVLFTSQNVFPDVPLQVIFRSSPERIRVKRDERGRISGLRIEFAGSVGYMMFLFPCGIEMLQPHEVTEEKISEWITLSQKYAQRAVARPVKCEDHYKATKEKVDVVQKFSYRILEDEWNTKPLFYAPLPPPLSIAEKHLESIKLSENCVREEFPTKYGFLYGVEDSFYSSYSLPVPDTRRDLAFPAERYEELQKKLESDFEEFMSYHLDAPEVGNPGNYSFVFQYSFVLMVFHLLSPEKRKRLEETIKEGLKKVCDPDCSYIGPGKRKCYTWYNRKEPFSGIDFNMTYLHVGGINRFKECSKETIENTDILMVETDWGNAMSLYGTYFGALFTNSWDLIKENWQVFRHAFDYYLHAMDWACMCAAYCENGISWSDGTNYGGYLGFLNMAEMLGKEEDLALGRYAYSKMFAMRAALFHAAEYHCKYHGVENWYSVKFFHEEVDASRAFLSYPASLVENNCRTEALYNITTEGHYKEALDAYCTLMNKQMMGLMDAFLHARKRCAPWEERPEGAEDIYHTSNEGVTGWQEVYSFFMCCIKLGLMTEKELEEHIEEALKNKRIAREFLGHVQWSKRRVPAYWTYTYLLSTLYGRNEEKLSCWKGVEIVKAIYPVLEIRKTSEDAFLEFRCEKTPSVTFNGKIVQAEEMGNDLWRIYPTENGTVKFN